MRKNIVNVVKKGIFETMPQDIVSYDYPYFLNVKKIMETTHVPDLLKLLRELHDEYVDTLHDQDVEVLQTHVIKMAQKLSNRKNSLS